jgi:hypothetical protein
MAASSPHDLVALARSFGIDRAHYPPLEAFRQLGISRSFGWELIARGELETIHLAPRRPVVTAASMARLLETRRQNPPKSSAAGRRRKAS